MQQIFVFIIFIIYNLCYAKENYLIFDLMRSTNNAKFGKNV